MLLKILVKMKEEGTAVILVARSSKSKKNCGQEIIFSAVIFLKLGPKQLIWRKMKDKSLKDPQ